MVAGDANGGVTNCHEHLIAKILVVAACIAFNCAIKARADAKPQVVLNTSTSAEARKRPITLADLITLKEIGGVAGEGLSVSPNGHYVAFEVHQADLDLNSYRVGWFISALDEDSVPVYVGDGGDPTLFRARSGAWETAYAQWAPDSSGIAYRKKVAGRVQVWWSSRDGSREEQLTHNAADVESFRWNLDGSQIYFTTGAPRIELRELAASRYLAGHVYDYEKGWSAIDAKPYYPPHELTGGRPRVRIIDVETGLERIATSDEIEQYEQLVQPNTPEVESRDVRPRHAVWSKDARGIAWVQADDPARQGATPPLTVYASRAVNGSNPIRCPAPECTGMLDLTRLLREGLHWSSIEDEVFFVRMEGIGYSKGSLYGWRPGNQHARKILTTDEWISDCSIVGNEAVCFRETPSYPRTIISIDLANGSINTLVDPNPEFQNLIIGDVELMEWSNSLDYETFGFLVKPPGYVPGHRYPLVFVGYRARRALRGGTGNEYPVHLFAANGFVVLVYERPTNYVAYEVYSEPIDYWSKANWGADMFDFRMPLASFESAIQILAERGMVDPTRVGVTGLSNGVGHVNYAIIHSNLFAAAITSSSYFGPSNYFLVGSPSAYFRKHRSATGLGRYGEPDGFLWQHISLALNAERVNTPLLINAADSEHLTAMEEVVTLIESNKAVEMVVYPDEYHIKWQPAHRLSVYERNIDWFNYWLQEIEDPDPDKLTQYARWRRLRQAYDADKQ